MPRTCRGGWEFSPTGVQPLDLSKCSPKGLKEATEAARSLVTHPVGSVTPAAVAKDPPRREIRDVLKSGYAPGSAGDRAFTALHRVEVHDDPANSHADNENIFRAANVAQASRSPRFGYRAGEDIKRYDDLKESERAVEDQRLADDVASLADLCGESQYYVLDDLEALAEDRGVSIRETVDMVIAETDALAREHGISFRDAIGILMERGQDALAELEDEETSLNLEASRERFHRELTERVRAQLQGIRDGIQGAVRKKRAPGASAASGGARPDNSFKPSPRKQRDHITTAPRMRARMTGHLPGF